MPHIGLRPISATPNEGARVLPIARGGWYQAVANGKRIRDRHERHVAGICRRNDRLAERHCLDQSQTETFAAMERNISIATRIESKHLLVGQRRGEKPNPGVSACRLANFRKGRMSRLLTERPVSLDEQAYILCAGKCHLKCANDSARIFPRRVAAKIEARSKDDR